MTQALPPLFILVADREPYPCSNRRVSRPSFSLSLPLPLYPCQLLIYIGRLAYFVIYCWESLTYGWWRARCPLAKGDERKTRGEKGERGGRTRHSGIEISPFRVTTPWVDRRLNLPSHLLQRISLRPTIASYRFYPLAISSRPTVSTTRALPRSPPRYHLDNLYGGGSLKLQKGWRIASTLQLNPISLCRGKGAARSHAWQMIYSAVVSSSMRLVARVRNRFLSFFLCVWSEFDKLFITRFWFWRHGRSKPIETCAFCGKNISVFRNL